MGLIFGRMPNNGFWLYFRPEVTPHPLKEPSNNPQEGFPYERKRRITTACHSELLSAKIPLEDRDYCSQPLLDYRACRKDVWPFPVFCTHEKHVFLNCKYDDYILRMKEYERERRMMERNKRYENFLAAQNKILEAQAEENDDDEDEEDDEEDDEDEDEAIQNEDDCEKFD